MDRIVLATGVLSLLLLATPAQAQDDTYYVLQKRLQTGFYMHIISGDGFWAADRKIEELFAEEVAKVKKAVDRFGGQILVVNTTKLGIGDEDKLRGTASGLLIKDGKHTLYRRKGELSVLFVGSAPLPTAGLLADAEQVVGNGTAKVALRAYDRVREQRIGRRRTVEVSLEELRAIRTTPAAVKRTGYGALLRNAWSEVLGDVEDDLELIEARMDLDFGGLDLSKGGFCLSIHSDERVSSDHADLVLGRKKTVADKWNSFIGRYDEPTDLDAEAVVALSKLRYASESDWNARVALRAKDPKDLTKQDLLGAAAGAAGRIPVAD